MQIKKKPYPILPIGELLRKLERFNFVTSIDVSMGYHHIPLTKRAQNICTIITPYGKYSYKRLPMGLASAPSYFQDKIDELFGDLPYVKAYIDDILIISYSDAQDHLQKVQTVFRRLNEAGLRAKTDKVQIMKKEMIYLGYKISTEGISPDPSKIQAIMKLKRQRTVKEVRGFIGTIINVVVDNLSRLPIQDDDDDKKIKRVETDLMETINAEFFATEIKEEEQGFQLDFKNVAKAQQDECKTEKKITEQISNSDDYGTTMIDGEDLITFRN